MAERGRPRTEGIPRYNVASGLRQHEKFFKFRRVLKISDKEAYTILHAFWEFVALNYAFKGTIADADPDVIAEYCWWEGETDQLMQALHTAGFVEEDGAVHDWFPNQPLAEYTLARRKNAEIPKSDAEIPESGNYDVHKSPEGGILNGKKGQREDKEKLREENSITTAKISDASRACAHEDGATSPVQKNPDLDRRILDFIHELEAIVSLNGNDKAGIFDDLRAHGKPEDLNWTLDQLRMAKADGRLGTSPGITNPIGWIRKKIHSHAPG